MTVLRWAVCLSLLFSSLVVQAQAALTGVVVKSALEDAIADFRQALSEATQNLRSLGDSLQANAQNVIADIDRVMGSKLNLTFDRLDQTELRLMEDAQSLTRQMTQATQQIVNNFGEQARATIVEADITAYNASYSLPCRDAKPRLLASFPARLIAGRDTPVMTLKGNFLRQGDLKATVNGVPTQIVERLDRQISIAIPAAILKSAEQEEVILSSKVDGFEEITRNLRMWGWAGCQEKHKTAAQAPIAFTVLEPPVTYAVTGTVKYKYTAYRDVSESSQPFVSTGSSRCNDNYRADAQWCIQGPGMLKNANVSDVSAHCNSAYQGTVPSGPRCVLVRGVVAGCGRDCVPGTSICNCKGRGWLRYNIQLEKSEPFLTETLSSDVAQTGGPGVKSFTISMPSTLNLTNPSAWYALKIHQMQGKKHLYIHEVSHANPNSGPVETRVNNEILSVDITTP